MIYDYNILVDTCWVRGCTEKITLRECNTSTYCKQHEANTLADLFGLPPKEECVG